MSVEPLAGYTIGITAARREQEFAAALERRGAKVVSAPAIRTVPLADDSELQSATSRCLASHPDIVIATTGFGFGGWMEAADAWGLGEELRAAIASATVLARGPKARGAVRAAGLREAWAPESESVAEVSEHLLAGDLRGKRIAVQLHGEPLTEMIAALRGAGAEVVEVPVYRWVRPDDIGPLHRLIESVAGQTVDGVAFTSAPAAVSFLREAGSLGRADAVLAALHGPVVLACVGTVTAAPFLAVGMHAVMPDRARLGALVKEIVEQVPARRGVTLLAAGRTLEIRGQAALLDGALIPLTSAAMTLLRDLARGPGNVVPRGGHAVEVAVARLRAALGDPRIIETVPKRGYRLARD